MPHENADAMLIFSDRGPVSVDERDVIACYSEYPNAARQCAVTLVLSSGVEISGFAHAAAVSALQAKLADVTPPPMAA
jgi:hypothetical protein